MDLTGVARRERGRVLSSLIRAFLVIEAAMAQRLLRAKKKNALAGIPFEVPGPRHFEARLDGVLQVIYLVSLEAALETIEGCAPRARRTSAKTTLAAKTKRSAEAKEAARR